MLSEKKGSKKELAPTRETIWARQGLLTELRKRGVVLVSVKIGREGSKEIFQSGDSRGEEEL